MFLQLLSVSKILILCAALYSVEALAQAQKSTPAAKPVAQPQPAKAPGTAQPPVDKIDVTDLENKYWAAKDTEFNVVQNRLYTKAKRFALSGVYGTMVNDPWSDGQSYGASLAYYFSDRYGIEANYSFIDSKDNKATKQLSGTTGAYPNHNKVRGFTGASFLWVPFYAKMSLLNSAVLYFDMSFALGAGMQDYQQQREDGNVMKSTPAVTLDVSQHFFLNRYFAIRVDLKNRWYREDLVVWRNSTAALLGRNLSTDTSNTTMLMLGLTFLY